MKALVRFAQLVLGLAIYGLGVGAMVDAKIGISPWDVFAQGLSNQLHLSFGWATALVSVLVLLAWVPLRQKPGIGTVLNAVSIGAFADLFMPFLPKFDTYPENLAKFVLGMLLLAFATGMYISSRFGPGPRDGLVVGTQKALGHPLWLVRTVIEGGVMTLGWFMGGQIREGTLIFAMCIGILMQTSMKAFKIKVSKK
ncbi:MAG: hypothetical protein RL196_102 [Actinomycetota bacterium]